MLSATIGVACLLMAGLLDSADLGPVWLTWWLGDASGDLVVAPFLLAWSKRHDLHGRWTDAVEVTAVLAALVLGAEIAFGGLLAPTAHRPLSFICLPPLVWPSYRSEGAAPRPGFGGGWHRDWGHAQRAGNVRRVAAGSAVAAPGLLATVSVTSLMLAAVVGQRRSSEAGLRHIAASDALAGLANYRRLIAVIGRGAAPLPTGRHGRSRFSSSISTG